MASGSKLDAGPSTGPRPSFKSAKGKPTRKEMALTALLVAFVRNRPVKSLITVENFTRFPAEWQKELISMLPKVDQIDPTLQSNMAALKNEYFSYACVQFSDQLKNAKIPQQLKQATKAFIAECTPESVSKKARSKRKSRSASQKSAKGSCTVAKSKQSTKAIHNRVTNGNGGRRRPCKAKARSKEGSSTHRSKNRPKKPIGYLSQYDEATNTGIKQCFVELQPLPRMLINLVDKKLAIVVDGEKVHWRTWKDPTSRWLTAM